ncbi:MAG: PAS domain S-box protein [Ignavibacteria bacterium]|nr:PAS domain S-box protein [Ignavibacteria bacterium]
MYRAKFVCNLIFLFILLSLIPDITLSQYYCVQKYNVDNGLKSRIIFDAAQDSSGMIWFATNFGVSVYDGYEFKNFSSKDNLPQVSYRKVRIDSKGFVWVLPSFDYDTILNYNYKDGRWNKFPPVNSSVAINPAEFTSFDVIYKDNVPCILVGTIDGLYFYEGNWKKLNNSDNPPLNVIRNIFTNSGKYYICSDGGMYTFDGINFDYSPVEITNGKPVYAGYNQITEDGKFKIWILENNRMGYLMDGKYYPVSASFTLPNTFILQFYNISATKDYVIFGNEWSKYITELSSLATKELSIKNGFTTDGMSSALVDRENNIWITDTRGVDKINYLDVESYNGYNGLFDFEVTAIIEKKSGEIVLGHNSGMTVYDRKEFRKIDFVNNKEYIYHSSRVQDMCLDANDNVWLAATRMGLGKYKNNGSVEWYKTPGSVNCNSVMFDKKGNILALTSGGVCILKNNKLEKYIPQDKFKNSYRKIYEIDDAYYVVGLSGAFKIKDGVVTELSYPGNSLPPNIYTLYRMNGERILAGASDGIYEINGTNITKSTEFVFNSPVYVIKGDLHNHLWIGTNYGIVKYKNKDSFKRYKKDNGLAGDEINRSAVITDKYGVVWVGTETGVSRLNENHDINIVPRVLMQYVTDNKDKEYNLNDNIEIENTNNTLLFSFRGISYINEKLMTYRIRLEGCDNDWITLTQSEIGNVRYTNLKPGEYKFLVSVKNEGSDWSPVFASGTISILRPFYLKWWFLLLNLFVLFFIYTVLTNIKIVKSYNKKLNREIEVKKIIERALTESEGKYRAVVEQTKEGIVLFDVETLFVKESNNSYEKMLGYTKEEMRELNIYDVVDLDKSSIDLFIDRIKREGSFFVGDRCHIKKDGTKLPVEVYVTLIEYLGKKAMCVLARDITDRKTNEEILRRNNEELEKAIASKDKFFSIVAHDLKSPFQGLVGYTELMSSNYSNFTEEERMNFAKDLNSVSKNLFQLVNNLLQWSQLQTNRMKYHPESFHIFELIQNAEHTYETNFEQKEIKFDNQISRDAEIYADKMMTDIIFRNLISNSLKFSNKGGVISLSSETNGDYELISVKDEGVGIPNEIIPKLFDITSKYTTKGTEEEDGTGLGLILCSEMAELNKGKISVISTWGKGSVFTVKLPNKKIEKES